MGELNSYPVKPGMAYLGISVCVCIVIASLLIGFLR